jgi:glycosyltransferase involved in cell wall biosynthesis
MCAADAVLMTSFSEGSPQVIKEALACGCPIVSVDVGDVKERIEGVDGCYVGQTREAKELAKLLTMALQYESKTEGRERIEIDGLNNSHVADQLFGIYQRIIE